MLQAANSTPNGQQQNNEQQMSANSQTLPKKNTTYLMILDMLQVFVSKWYWFVICVAIGLSLSWAYLLTTPPRYTREASILIKNEMKGTSVEKMSFIEGNMDVNNELFTLRSPIIAEAVVRQLHLNMNYYSQGRFHEVVVYGTTLNIEATPLDLNDNDDAEFWISLKEDGTYVIKDFTLNGIAKESSALLAKVGQTISTPIGRIKVEKAGAGFAQEIDMRIHRKSISQAKDEVVGNLSVSAVSEMSTIISLKYEDYNVQRADDVLSTIISVYNANWLEDRNKAAISTTDFIKTRLKVIEEELGAVEDDISEYKSANLIPGTGSDVVGSYVGQASSASMQISELNNQLYMARYVRNYLTDESNKYQLIPANQGANAGLGGEISEYNMLLRTRNSLLNASSIQNPIVQDYEVQLNELRNSLVASVDNHIAELTTTLRSVQAMQSVANREIANSPQKARYLLSFERQQKVKESLYLYLLQKREENELSQAFTAYNSRTITPASGSNDPTSPVRPIIWAIGLIAGIVVPGALIFLGEAINNKVRGRRDLEDLSIPFLGEIPFYRHKRKFKEKLKSKWENFWYKMDFLHLFTDPFKEDKTLHIFVKERSRNVVNEAFRVVRTNIEFMTANEQRGRVIMLTSCNPNSGKTFVASNIVTSFAINNKRVIAIDLDMRKASLSAMVDNPKIGIADYLSGITDDLDECIVREATHKRLDVLPVGTTPPNPTELLFEPRLKELIERFRDEYDYIFIDCPPVEIVADATIVGQHVDMTLFVIRAEVLDRSLLPDIQKYYDTQRLPKMATILNGTADAFSYYGYHRYGARYGYYGAGSYGGYTHDD